MICLHSFLLFFLFAGTRKNGSSKFLTRCYYKCWMIVELGRAWPPDQYRWLNYFSFRPLVPGCYDELRRVHQDRTWHEEGSRQMQQGHFRTTQKHDAVRRESPYMGGVLSVGHRDEVVTGFPSFSVSWVVSTECHIGLCWRPDNCGHSSRKSLPNLLNFSTASNKTEVQLFACSKTNNKR